MANYIAAIRRFVLVATGILGMSVLSAPSSLAAIRSSRTERSINPCTLLTDRQAAIIMGVAPLGGPSRDQGGCSWQTDPTDRAHLSYVTVDVQLVTKLLGKRYPDIRTYLDKSTTVGIDPLPRVGDEAFSTYSALSGPGTSDDITVRVGKNVLSIGFQRPESVANPSAEFDQIVTVVRSVVPRMRGKR